MIDWERLRLYPALLALYSIGIATIARGNYETLARAMIEPTVIEPNTRTLSPAIMNLHPFILTPPLAGRLEPNHVSPDSALVRRLWFQQDLWSALREYVPHADQFRAIYDRFEYLLGLCHADLRLQMPGAHDWGPIGAIAWRPYEIQARDFINEVNAVFQARGGGSIPVEAGLFGGSMDRFLAAKASIDQRLLAAGF